jgi:hypothetical protein
VPGATSWKMPKRKTRVEDSDDDVRIFEKKARLADSDDEIPLFGPNGLAEKLDLAKKIRQQEEEQESQQPLAPEDYLKQEVGFSHEELNVEAVDEAETRLGVLESLASTPSRNESEVSHSFQDDDEIARKAAAKMTRFAGKETLKIKK